ncbi:hypothetical protein F7725_020760 [Dissostichus mawsoni]|uniref:Uncharacterized protein n=1 Tax=Dissostichus mawsoni TaxID=36200 RepID=A0A7J5YE41_DISMA|nr:hypothetical protein F7725_020760 [Dissostichus mawsoni]
MMQKRTKEEDLVSHSVVFGFGNFFQPGEPLATWSAARLMLLQRSLRAKYEGPQLDIWVSK